MTLLAGVCRFCGCSDLDPCPEGCAWTDRSCTVCSQCEQAAKAERQALKAHPIYTAIQRTIYHFGFLAGWFGQRTRNPYIGRSGGHTYDWNRGRDAGADAARVHRNTFGPITNAPRARLESRRLERAMMTPPRETAADRARARLKQRPKATAADRGQRRRRRA